MDQCKDEYLVKLLGISDYGPQISSDITRILNTGELDALDTFLK